MMETGFNLFCRNQNRTESGLQASCLIKNDGQSPSFFIALKSANSYLKRVETGLRPVSTYKYCINGKL